MALKREPTPAGPVGDLFDRLHDLHLRAGEPGVRQMASGIGRGVLSYTTVHNVFRGPRVPRWGHLELIVEQLGGDVEAFRNLWMAARLAERSAPAASPAVPTPTGSSAVPTPAVAPAVASPASLEPGYEFVMVGLRQPIEASAGPGHGAAWWRYRPGGVGVALSDLVAARAGVWVGWAGQTDAPRAPEGLPDLTVHPVVLTADEVERYYEGYCNSTIWPLYHDAIERPEFHHEWQEAGWAVSRRFADATARVCAPGATVWVHDYHLQLVPDLLRRRRPDLRIGFFLHVPFPPLELFLQLPDRAEILRGLLGADLVGFQTPPSVHNFLRAVGHVLRLEAIDDGVLVDERRVAVGAFPISVDIAAIQRVVNEQPVHRRAAQVRAELGNPRILLVGVDRLDYTKGIEQRLLAFGELLAEGRLPRESTAFLQVATLTRERIARYAQLRERVSRLAGDLNGTHGRPGSPVVHYTHQGYDFHQIAALYVAADVMVVTPFRDGMNLVAKEYVASRVDNRGALVLSEFAGSAADLDGAILVNPHDLQALKNGILRACALSRAEQGQRMRGMRRHLQQHDIHAWTSAFLSRLASA